MPKTKTTLLLQVAALAAAGALAGTASAAAPPGLCGFVNPDGMVWDFTALTLTNSSYTVSGGGYDYEFNVCAPLTQNPPGSTCSGSVSVCQLQGGEPVAAEARWGTGALAPEWGLSQAGNPSMVTNNGDVCFSTQSPRVTTIEFVCKQGATKPSVLSVTEPTLCHTTVTVATELACKPQPAPGCFVQAHDGLYDLSPLAGQVFEASQGGYQYSVGVCGTQVPCGSASDAWACQDADSAAITLGRWASSTSSGGGVAWSIEEGLPSLASRNGDVCYPSLLPRSAGIQFTCQLGGTGPLQVTSKGCAYLFTLPTPLACLHID